MSGEKVERKEFDTYIKSITKTQQKYYKLFVDYLASNQKFAYDIQFVTNLVPWYQIRVKLGIPVKLFDLFICFFYIQRCYLIYEGKPYTRTYKEQEAEWMKYPQISRTLQQIDRKHWKKCLDNARLVCPKISKSIYFNVIPFLISDNYQFRMRFCVACGRREVHKEVRLGTCAGCNIVTYCSEECQIKDWEFHKLLCLKTRIESSIDKPK